MTAPVDRSGAVLGDYTLQRLIGRGGMGEVYQALDSRRGRTVALKLLYPQFAGDAVFRERFLRESRTAASINNPHVIPIHDWGEINGHLFLDMRIVEGRDLRGVLAHGPLAPERAVSIIEQIAHALDAAHVAGLVHRDVKPDNILIDSSDFAYLVDFGLAQTTTDSRLTQTGEAVGSFAYMAPERFAAGNIANPLTDVYALTCVLFEFLSGTAPFGAGDLQVLVASHLNQLPPMTGSVFDPVIARGMAKNPAERFATAGELARAAREALSALAPQTQTTSQAQAQAQAQAMSQTMPGPVAAPAASMAAPGYGPPTGAPPMNPAHQGPAPVPGGFANHPGGSAPAGPHAPGPQQPGLQQQGPQHAGGRQPQPSPIPHDDGARIALILVAVVVAVVFVIGLIVVITMSMNG